MRIVVSASRTPRNASSSVSRFVRTSSRINRSTSLAPSASAATSSSTDVVDAPPVVSASVLDRLNASRAYATASNVAGFDEDVVAFDDDDVVVVDAVPRTKGSSDGLSRTTRRNCSIIAPRRRSIDRSVLAASSSEECTVISIDRRSSSRVEK